MAIFWKNARAVDLSNFSKNEFFQEQENIVQISWEQEKEQEIQNMQAKK